MATYSKAKWHILAHMAILPEGTATLPILARQLWWTISQLLFRLCRRGSKTECEATVGPFKLSERQEDGFERKEQAVRKMDDLHSGG